MEVNAIVDALEQKEEFKKWKKENYASSLVHLLKIFDGVTQGEWQIGFFNPNETITTFTIGQNNLTISPDEEIFKKPEDKIRKLNLEDVKIDYDAAIQKAQEFQKAQFSSEMPVRTMMILQHLDMGQIYNITFITKSFRTLNIKVDAVSGAILKHELITLQDLQEE